MGANTNISWTNHTASPWYGCQHKILDDGSDHPGCAHCYAETMSKRNPATLGIWGQEGTRVLSKSFWDNCRRWNRQAEKLGARQKLFPSVCDPFENWPGPILDNQGRQLFHESFGYTHDPEFPAQREIPCTMDDLRADLFLLIEQCQSLDFLLLTKRPENILRMWPQEKLDNAWIGTSISDQHTANELVPALIKCHRLSPVLFLSVEPLLGRIDLTNAEGHIDWVIVGGESGHGARPMHPDWVRSLLRQCQAADVAFHFKQWGEWAPLEHHHVMVPTGNYAFTPSGEKVTAHDRRELFIWPAKDNENDDSFSAVRVGKRDAGRLLDGREWNEFPQVKELAAK